MSEVASALAALYKPEHAAQGGILTTDRWGVQRLYPLLSVSVAALVNDEPRADVSAEDLSYHLAPIKARAKTQHGQRDRSRAVRRHRRP